MENFQRNFRGLPNLYFADVTVVWNEGIELPVPLERFRLLVKTQEFLHPLLAKVFAEARGVCCHAR
jgi:hypothetical protein